MPTPITQHLKTAHADLTGEQALQAPVDVLLGVSPAAKAALEPLHIATVFDLAASQLFATASLLLDAETDPLLAEARMNTAAADAVNAPPGVPIGEWARRDLALLAGLTPEQAASLRTGLDVTTVRDLALWPPYRAARSLLETTLGASAAAGEDPEAPAELQPRSGSHATERVFFRKLVIDLAPQADQGASPLEQLTGIDLASALAAPNGFQRLATGALLTFQQSWFSQGVSLGQLLHSLSLAPGESTRVAVVDWTRTSSARTSESIDERERLASDQTHTRALSEVTESTANEFQAGASRTSVTSSTSQSGGALGLDLGPLALGGSHGGSSSKTEAMSASSSFGARDMAASLGQEVNDRTQQHASSARSRRASAVREVSQSEHETITTRVVTNYNHMHALTVQYYETVQAYRVTTELHRAERCLFVPLKLLDFQVAATVDRLRAHLAEAALTPAAFLQLTSEYGAVEIIPQTPRVLVGNVGLSDIFVRGAVLAPAEPGGGAGAGGAAPIGGVSGVGRAVIRDTAGTLAGTAITREGAGAETAAAAGAGRATVDLATAGSLTLEHIRFDHGPANTPTAVAAVKGWNLPQLNRLASLAGRIVLRRNSDSAFVPHDAQLLGVALREGQATRFRIQSRDNAELPAHATTATSLVLAKPAAFGAVKSIALQNAQDRDLTTVLVLSVSVNGSVVALDVPVQFKSKATAAGLQEVVRFGEVGPAPELVEHLQSNRLHYSLAVFQRLDEAAIGGLLARFTYKGLALSRVVDPRPVAVTSNFLAFRVNVPLDGGLEDERFASEQAEFKTFLAQRGLDRPMPQSQIVPLPSGGVFAEAVLGRFNSAEKIDLKRFWNWQDSPIPITAPEIAPIAAGSRAEDETLRPGQLGAPVVTIQSPTALPAAAGVGPILSAIQTANLFRDMSGMAQTGALAQSAVAASGAGATSAGDIAAQNLKTTMEQKTARMKIAADLLGSMAGAGAGGGAAGGGGGAGGGNAPAGRGTVSERGGELRAAEAIDQKAAASGAAGGATGAGGTLEQETLAKQTGSDLSGAGEKIVATATTPEPQAPRRTTPRAGSSPAPRPTTPATPSQPPPTEPPAVPEVRRYRMEIDFGTTEGVSFGGERQARVNGVFEQLGEARGGPGFPLVITFQTAAESVLLNLSVAPQPGAAPFTATKSISLRSLIGNALGELNPASTGFVGRAFGGGPVRAVGIGVRPTVKEKTFKIGMVGLAQPNEFELEQKLSEAGIKPSQRIGQPEFVLSGAGYDARVRWMSRTPIVQQFF